MFSLLLPLACASPEVASEVATVNAVRDVTVADLSTALNARQVPILVDVRTPQEYAGGHVPGAINLPVDQIASRAGELASYKSGEVWLICQSGGRSATAARTLGGLGYRSVNVLGGTGGWKAAGFPTEP